MMQKKTVVGVAGVARAGKDTFYKLSEKYVYEELGLSCKRYALADVLKDECRDYLRDKFGLDVYSQDQLDKEKFRPFLVWYGDRKREQTQATYFTKILEEKIKKDKDVDVAIITDIRYGEYPDDEIHWLVNHMGGKLIHISRFDKDGIDLVPPANENERRNDPIVYSFSHHKLTWSSIIDPLDRRFIDKMYELYRGNIREFYSKTVNLKKKD
jgi:hypothetical protein